MLSYLDDGMLYYFNKCGVKYTIIGNKGEIDFTLSNYPHIYESYEQICEALHPVFPKYDLDFEIYGKYKYFPLTTRLRGYEVTYHGMEDNYYALSYDGKVDKYKDFDEEIKDEKSEVDYELKFECSEKNKSFKDENGEIRKKKPCREFSDDEYYDLINTKKITCKHVIHYLMLQTAERAAQKSELLNKEGDNYRIWKLTDIDKYMPLGGQFMILVTCRDFENYRLTRMSVNYVEKENRYLYYFHGEKDPTVSRLRVIPVPNVNINPVIRNLVTEEEAKQRNGFYTYGTGVILVGGQNYGNFINRAIAEEEKIPVPDDIIPDNTRGYGLNQQVLNIDPTVFCN